MRPFSYERPTSLAAAFRLLDADDAPVAALAGGTDLLIRLRDGSVRPDVVVDLKSIAEIDGRIRERDGWLVIGGQVVMTDIAEHPRIQRDFTALADAASIVGSAQIRNRATLAGNICNASPAADTSTSLLVYGAEVVAAGSGGTRRIPIDDFFVGPGRTALVRGELVTAIELPLPSERRGGVHVRRTRRRGHDLASVTLTCAVFESGGLRLAYGSVGPRPVLVTDASGVLTDRGAASGAKDEVLDRLFAAATPSPRSMRASPAYRLAMLRVLALRAVDIAAGRLARGAAA
jgi:CO/xanthine dehydrogenase FAD-binding subunit